MYIFRTPRYTHNNATKHFFFLNIMFCFFILHIQCVMCTYIRKWFRQVCVALVTLSQLEIVKNIIYQYYTPVKISLNSTITLCTGSTWFGHALQRFLLFNVCIFMWFNSTFTLNVLMPIAVYVHLYDLNYHYHYQILFEFLLRKISVSREKKILDIWNTKNCFLGL